MPNEIEFSAEMNLPMEGEVVQTSVVTTAVAAPAERGRRGRPRIHPEGYRAARKEERATRQRGKDVSVAPSTEETEAEIAKRLDKTFFTLAVMIDGVVKGTVTSLIVAGAPGCGKTFTVENKLEAALRKNDLKKYSFIKGSMTGITLFKELWNHREHGQVLVIDDCDTIFYDMAAMNVLKAALDTGKTKYVTWGSETYLLGGIAPNRFEFKGTMIFISNLNFYKEIEKEGRASPHMNALMSRSMFLDLQIHSKREIMVRLEQVVQT